MINGYTPKRYKKKNIDGYNNPTCTPMLSLEEWVVTAMNSEKGYGADHSDLVTNYTPAFQLEVNANFG